MSCHGLKMAYRNLLKYKLQSVICVLGLAGGLSCFTVCNYMLREELAWNKQLPHYIGHYPGNWGGRRVGQPGSG